MEHDSSYLSTADMYLARILVNTDLRNGLPEDIIIRQRGERIQILDYEGVSFRCRCHKYGHLVRECEFPLHKRADTSPIKRKESSPKSKESVQMANDPIAQSPLDFPRTHRIDPLGGRAEADKSNLDSDDPEEAREGT